MRSDNPADKLPLQIYLSEFEAFLGDMECLINNVPKEDLDYFFFECFGKPFLIGLEQHLSFVYSPGNLKLFHRNYKSALKLVQNVLVKDYQQELAQAFLDKFSLQTYMKMMLLETSDKYVEELA